MWAPNINGCFIMYISRIGEYFLNIDQLSRWNNRHLSQIIVYMGPMHIIHCDTSREFYDSCVRTIGAPSVYISGSWLL